MEIKPIQVAVLAATGSVGQRFIQLLDNHPWFKVVALTASDRSEGRRYEEACHWIIPEKMPAWAKDMVVLPNTVEAIKNQGDVKIVFSALPTEIAKACEHEFAEQGIYVCSNASAYRKEEDVPILLPEVNPDHLDLLPIQQRKRGWKGAIITNPNCTSTGLTVVLKALHDHFGVKTGFVVSMQAISGAGYPGVPSLDILDNVVPFIGGEESKVEWEPRKMIGKIVGEKITLAPFILSAHTNRVAVSDGHLVCLSVQLEKEADIEEVVHCLRNYKAPDEIIDLPSCPKPVIEVLIAEDRPQPRLDRMIGKGMTTVVGRVRKDPIATVKMIILSHNTIRGAAGGSLFNAELLVKRKMRVLKE